MPRVKRFHSICPITVFTASKNLLLTAAQLTALKKLIQREAVYLCIYGKVKRNCSSDLAQTDLTTEARAYGKISQKRDTKENKKNPPENIANFIFSAARIVTEHKLSLPQKRT